MKTNAAINTSTDLAPFHLIPQTEADPASFDRRRRERRARGRELAKDNADTIFIFWLLSLKIGRKQRVEAQEAEGDVRRHRSGGKLTAMTFGFEQTLGGCIGWMIESKLEDLGVLDDSLLLNFNAFISLNWNDGPHNSLCEDEKEEDVIFCFDRVFYQDSEQVEVCDFLATPIIEGALNAINGTILIYGQGPSVLDEDQKKKGLLPRVVDGLFEGMKSFGEMTKWTVKLTMVEIYMDKIRDLFDASKDNIQIKENKCQGIFLSGATEMPIKNAMDALRCFHRGISNRAVGETQMNVASSRSHSLYIFSVQQESASDVRSKIGKVVLVDLAGSEKTEKTGAGGTVLEEAKSINKSLSALGNVINALTTGIPDSPGSFKMHWVETPELRCFAAVLLARQMLQKASPRFDLELGMPEHFYKTLLDKLRENLTEEDIDMLEQLFKQEGLIFVPETDEELEAAIEVVRDKIISEFEQTVERFRILNIELMRQNQDLEAELAIAREVAPKVADPAANTSWFRKVMKYLDGRVRIILKVAVFVFPDYGMFWTFL
ncbi:hypothetical protein ZIOFF_025554 [Zingiber officinale]|uniref:Kinesin-like protein n=1 Tax=Zingiber officinale TaxID=94328 RepID=A0A8J5HBV7_ZINOF|nr:hypothetical protein ZIOFF_025554 [Zingiber officinale]